MYGANTNRDWIRKIRVCVNQRVTVTNAEREETISGGTCLLPLTGTSGGGNALMEISKYLETHG